MNDSTAALWADALAYCEAHGQEWAHRAVAHARLLSGRRDREGLQQWLQIIDLLIEIHHPETGH